MDRRHARTAKRLVPLADRFFAEGFWLTSKSFTSSSFLKLLAVCVFHRHATRHDLAGKISSKFISRADMYGRTVVRRFPSATLSIFHAQGVEVIGSDLRQVEEGQHAGIKIQYILFSKTQRSRLSKYSRRSTRLIATARAALSCLSAVVAYLTRISNG